MSMQKKTLDLIEAAHAILEESNPMTVRQLHYQLFSKHVSKRNLPHLFFHNFIGINWIT